MAKYTFDKYMMAGDRLEVSKAFNSKELKEPCAVMISRSFFTEKGLRNDGLVVDWHITIGTPGTKSPVALTEFEFLLCDVAYNGEGLKTGEFYVGDFEADGVAMNDYYSYFPADTALHFEDNGGKQVDLYYINSKGDYETTGEKFTFAENTESFSITWQDDIPDGKSEFLSGFVVRTTPYTDPDPRR